MKVLKRDAKEQMVKLRPETLDDLWHLHQIIAPGDRVSMATRRTPEETSERLRASKQPKQRITLTILVERVEFAEFSDRLRILGPIQEGPRDLGMHHAFSVEAEANHELSIVKPSGFRAHHWARMKEAEAASRRPLVTIVALDDEEAAVAILRQYGVQTVATIEGRRGGKQFESKDGPAAYFGEVLATLQRVRDDGTPLIVVGPGFTRESFVDFVKDKEPGFVKGLASEGTAHAGSVGIQEALKRGIVERIQKDQRVAIETRLVEEVFAEIARDGRVAYGVDDVVSCVNAGAAKSVLVTEALLRGGQGEAILDSARAAGAETRVVSTSHDAGKKLESLGGTAARLRFRP